MAIVVEIAAAGSTDMNHKIYFIASEDVKNYLFKNTSAMQKLLNTVYPGLIFFTKYGKKNTCAKFVKHTDEITPKQYINSAIDCIDEATDIYQITSDVSKFSPLNCMEILYALHKEKPVHTIHFNPGYEQIFILKEESL